MRLAIILDEHGGTSGLLTLTDVFSEVMGWDLSLIHILIDVFCRSFLEPTPISLPPETILHTAAEKRSVLITVILTLTLNTNSKNYKP